MRMNFYYFNFEFANNFDNNFAINFHFKSNQCFCGNSYGSYGAAAETDCWQTCNGNSAEICGGPWRNSVYKIGKWDYLVLNLRLHTNASFR